MSLPQSRTIALTSLLSSFAFLVSGCSSSNAIASAAQARLATGNWQISSSAQAADRLASLSGSLSQTGQQIAGMLHSQASTGCIAPGTSFAVTGTASPNQQVTLTGAVAGGTLSVTGTLAADGESLDDASYGIAGGTCAFASRVSAVAHAYVPVTGNYAGDFADADGHVAHVTANFSQSPSSTPDGNFTLSGTASVAGDPCFPTAVTVSNTQVTGGMFTFTYAANGASVTAHGTFSPDATVLNITSWTSSGACGSDTGIASTMTRQSS